MSGSGANLPIDIRLNGTAEAEAAFNRVSTTAGTAMQRVEQSTTQASNSAGRFGQAIGSAGFQVQDFAVQVQGGTSALTALSQQGSQFLGVFGTGGAIAGAVLTVGILGAQLAGLSSNSDKLKDALDALDAAYQATDASARQYRDSLEEEARRIRDLTAYYGSLSESVQVYERRRLSASAQTLRTERDQRVGEVVSPLTGVIGAARGDTAFDALGNSLGTVYEGTQALTTQMEQARQAIEAFQSATVPTRDSIADLANRLTSLGQVSGPTGDAIKTVLAAITANEAALLRTGEGMEQVRQRMAAAGVPMEVISRLLGATTLNADQLSAALDRLRNAANNPIGTLGTSLSNVNEELRALRTGGIAAADAAVRQQRTEAAVQAAQTRAEAFVRGNSGLGGDQLAEAIGQARQEAEGLARAVANGEGARDRLREQLTAAGRAARETSQEFQDLRLHTSGLLVGNTSEARVAGEIAANPAVRAQQALRTTRERQEAESARTAEREAERRQNEADRFSERWGDRIALETTRGLIEGAKNGETAAQRFGNVLKSILMTSVSAVLSRNLFQPLVQAGYSAFSGSGVGSFFGFGGTLGGAAGVSTAGSVAGGLNQAGQSAGLYQAGRFGNLGGAFTQVGGMANTGIGFLDGALNTPISTLSPAFSNSSPAAFQSLVDGTTGTAFTAANAIGGVAGIAGGAYGIYSGIQKGGIGGAAGAAGGAISAGLGAATLASGLGLLNPGTMALLASLGPYGWAAAAILAIAGALLPGEKPSGKGQEARLDLATGAQELNGLGGKRFSQENRDAATDTVSRIADLAKSVGDKLGGARIGGEIAVGVTSSRGGGPGTLYLDVSGQKNQFTNDEEGSKKLAETAAEMILNEFKRQGTAKGDYRTILDRSSDINSLTQNLDWYEKVYKSFAEGAPKINAFDEAIKGVNASFQPLTDKAAQLGLATADLVTAWGKSLAEVTEQRDQQLTGYRDNLRMRSLRLGGDNLTADLIGFDAATKAEIKTAKKALEDLGLQASDVLTEIAALEKLRLDERLDLERRYQNAAAGSALGVVTNLRDYAAGLMTSSAGAGTAMDRYNASQREFDAVYGAAVAGDARSISGLQSAAESYRMNAREVFGGGQGFADAVGLIAERLDGISGLGSEALTQSFIAENARQNTDRLEAAIDRLTSENVKLRADLNMILMRPAA